MTKEVKSISIIDILKNIIGVYFDTFFVLYFFKVANYEIVPLVKYYLTVYLFIGLISFFIRGAMKKNIHVPYFRIGVSLQALYITLIMLLKENIVNYVILVGIVKGIADAFYHFPKNILDSEIVSNENRQKYDGIITIVNKVFSIVIPLILGIVLTYISYVNLGKIFFILFVIMFIVTFKIKDREYKTSANSSLKGFYGIVKNNKKLKLSLYLPFLAGLAYSSGVMSLIVTLSKIYHFKTNLNLGFVDSICAACSLIVCALYAKKIKGKHFKYILPIVGTGALISLTLMAVAPTRLTLIIYLFVRFTCITMVSLIAGTTGGNIANIKELKNEYKSEYYCVRELLYSTSRCKGYLLLLLVSLFIGVDSIYYILIISGLAIFVETIVLSDIYNNKEVL